MMINLCTEGCDVSEFEDIPAKLPEGSVLKTPYTWWIQCMGLVSGGLKIEY